mmetsp:Transcript_28863/g.27759  ORF Transcript_28863/g.27759 Transcript_28863/m.27759 type:complete len:93 (+) Transcript_28863:672-950(+)
MHLRELGKQEVIPETSDSKQHAEKDAEFIIPHFKEAIQMLEAHNLSTKSPKEVKELYQHQEFAQRITDKDQIIPEDFRTDNEQEYFECLQSP